MLHIITQVLGHETLRKIRESYKCFESYKFSLHELVMTFWVFGRELQEISYMHSEPSCTVCMVHAINAGNNAGIVFLSPTPCSNSQTMDALLASQDTIH